METISQISEGSPNNLKQNQIFEDSEENEVADIEIETEEEQEQEVFEPFDPTKIKIDTRQITIDLVLNKIKYGEIDLSPDFRRDSNIWNAGAKSRLIESMLIRIPLPAFYIDATDDDKWIVIDGLERLTAIKDFILGKDNDKKNEKDDKDFFRLSQLEFLTQFNGKSYDEIPRNYQRRIRETQIIIFLIEKGTPEEFRFNIFKRINTDGIPLSLQEIRHAIFQGKATKFLEKLAKSEEFKTATANSVRDGRMEDRETILRFLAFKIDHFSEYHAKDLDKFLNDAMICMNQMSDKDLQDLESDFYNAMSATIDIFGKEAFRKRFDNSAKKRPFNKALFESWAVNLSYLNYHQIELLKTKKDFLMDEFIKINNEDGSFIGSISQGTGTRRRVIYRFSKIAELINKVLNID